jgi:hypothetical protein
MKNTLITRVLSLGAACALGILAVQSSAIAEDKAAVKVKPYPLKTCIVSGEKLGEMGAPVVITNDNREIKLCCKNCLSDFKKDPAKYIKKLEEAEKKLPAKTAPAPAEAKPAATR